MKQATVIYRCDWCRGEIRDTHEAPRLSMVLFASCSEHGLYFHFCGQTCLDLFKSNHEL